MIRQRAAIFLCLASKPDSDTVPADGVRLRKMPELQDNYPLAKDTFALVLALPKGAITREARR